MLSYPEIDPVALDFGHLQIRWYGISYVAGILTAWWLLKRRSRLKRTDWTQEQIADLVFYATLGIIIGGRLGSVLFYNLPYYLDHPVAIFKINEGGMSFHGGLIGVLIAVVWYGRSIGKGFFNVSDFLVPVVPVGLGFGRVANFINGELWGAPSDVPWAMVFPDPRAGGVPRHPSQLYEALLEGLVLFLILWFFSVRPRPAMAVSGLFLLGYGVFRFAVEFVRMPDANIGYLAFDWVTMGQVLSLPMIVIGIVLLLFAYRTREE
jgi:phosphatidylglycerol:prolipoprotein diacylglycerol transferase